MKLCLDNCVLAILCLAFCYMCLYLCSVKLLCNKKETKIVSKIFKRAIRVRSQMFADHIASIEFDLIPLTRVFQYVKQNSFKMVKNWLMLNYTMMEHIMFCYVVITNSVQDQKSKGKNTKEEQSKHRPISIKVAKWLF